MFRLSELPQTPDSLAAPSGDDRSRGLSLSVKGLTALSQSRNRRGSRPHVQVERLETRILLSGNVVINEIHYDPNVDYEAVEFLELTNAGDAAMDLSGAKFTDGVDYTFPAGTSLAPGAYLVVAGYPGDVLAKWNVTAYGPWSGKLSNDGEKITLKSATGETLDTVTYGVGFPWPVTGEYGDSIELINPTFDNSLPGNWRQSNRNVEQTLVPSGSTWQYRKGTSEPPAAWKTEGFDVASDPVAWQPGVAPIGYGDPFDVTILSDMQNNYSTAYVRNTFEIPGVVPDTLTLKLFLDDGGIVYINGTEAARSHVTTGTKYYNSLAQDHEPAWETLTLTGMGSRLHRGTNTLAIQVLNALLTSNDFSVDAQLLVQAGQYGTPTPGSQNTVYATTTPPLLSDLTQSVQQPVSGQDVAISIRASDPSGVQNVTLEYQLVDPGNYVRLTDAAYQNWTSAPMYDDGLNGDFVAGDGVYTYVMPGSLQTNRRLVRYRIRATDNTNASIVAPYATDTQPNFAYYVYDGIPAWTGTDKPGVTAPVTFGTDITRSLQAYILIANSTDVSNSQWNSSYNKKPFYATMVYDGVVYDHILFNNRGEASTYQNGKNKWCFKFNAGHLFAARDNNGNLYAEKWSRIDMNANASPWIPNNRGMAGLDESVTMRLYQLAGIPASNTNYVQFRVVEGVNEAPADQYSGDLWGLYLAVEHTGGHWLNEHDLADGNVYKIKAAAGNAQNLSPDQVSDGSDWTSLLSYIRTTATPEDWWRANINLDDFFSFQAINRVDSNIDLRVGYNHIMYHAPDGHWVVVPWDMDDAYVPKIHNDGYTYLSNMLVYPALKTEYANRCRELLDLLFSDKSRTGGQVVQLVDEYARFVNDSDGAGGYLKGWAEIDQYLWNYNPHSSTSTAHMGNPAARGSFYVTPMQNTRNGGTWTRTLSSPDFKGMVQYVMDFMTDTDPDGWSINDGDQRGYGYNYLEYEAADTLIPNTPTVTYSGTAGFPSDKLKFSTSAYSDPDGSPYAAMEWRVGEISNPSTASFDPNAPWKYEINSVWESGELTTFASQMSIPSGILQQGHTYRVRVRFKDDTGRWSHWSDVASGTTEFTAGQPLDLIQNSLRITELNYHPVDNMVLPGSSPDGEDYEFIEFENFGAQSINLQNLQFDAGITMTFGDVTLAPGELGVVTHNTSAFQSRYGASIKVLGTYPGSKLDNGGEQVRLLNVDLSILSDFTYDDTGMGWYPLTDGDGYSLVVRDPASNPNLGDSASWRASKTLGGSPGIDETHPNVVGRYVFYNQSQFDGNSQAAGPADDAAVATNKTALLPGHTATFDNYTSYSRGLNGLIVDLGGETSTLSASDFIFRVGNDEETSRWTNASAPLTVLTRSRIGGVTRVEIVWENNAIQNQWLQVTLKGGAGSTSGLADDDVFYFGSAIGEAGNSPTSARVNAGDELVARADPTASAAITNPYDYNRDGTVNGDDQLIARAHITCFLNELRLISPPTTAAALPLAGSSTQLATLAPGFIGALVAAPSSAVPSSAAPSTATASQTTPDPLSGGAAATVSQGAVRAPSPLRVSPPITTILSISPKKTSIVQKSVTAGACGQLLRRIRLSKLPLFGKFFDSTSLTRNRRY